MTVLHDSTHSASMSPSSTIHWCLLLLLLAMSRKVVDSRPSFHSRVCREWVGGRAVNLSELHQRRRVSSSSSSSSTAAI